MWTDLTDTFTLAYVASIVHERGNVWVRDGDGQYTVYRQGATHSTADSSYPRTPDGRSLAIARADYLARKGVN